MSDYIMLSVTISLLVVNVGIFLQLREVEKTIKENLNDKDANRTSINKEPDTKPVVFGS